VAGNVATKDAQNKLRIEGCTSGMWLRGNERALKDAHIELIKEYCASSMGQRLNCAAKTRMQ
jgi:sulfur transfer protein SufE